MPVLRIQVRVGIHDGGVSQARVIPGCQIPGQMGEGRIRHLEHPVDDGPGQGRESAAQHLHADGQGGSLEVRCHRRLPLFQQDTGIVRGGIQLYPEKLPDKLKGIPHRTHDAEAVPEGQGILQGSLLIG